MHWRWLVILVVLKYFLAVFLFKLYFIIKLQTPCLKGLFTNFKCITFISCINKRNIFHKRFISIKRARTRNNWENGAQSQSVLYIIYNSTRSDWLWAPYFLNNFESELFYPDGTYMNNFSFVETQEKCYIFKIGEQSL